MVSGPSGVGKFSTIKIVCKEMGLGLIEEKVSEIIM